MNITHPKVRQALTSLVLQNPFFASLALKMEYVEDIKCKTFWTDGKRIGYNPNFADTLTLEEIIGVIAHEIFHVFLLHHTRFNYKNKEMWNKACDYVINYQLIQSGFTLPKGVLLDPRFTNTNAEDVYRILEQEENKKKEEEKQKQEQEKQESEEKDENGSGSGESDDSENDKDEDSDEGEDSKKEESKDSDEESDDENSSESDNSENSDDENDEVDEDSNGSDDSDEESDDSSEENDSQDKDGEGDESEADSNSESDSDSDDSDCGFGEVREPSEKDAETAEEDAILSGKLAESIAKSCGGMPAGMARMLADVRETKTEWKEILNRFISEVAAKDYSFMRANRRFLGRGIILPSLYSQTIGKVVIAVDCSGSVSPADLEKLAAEIASILDYINESKDCAEIEIVYFDAVVTGTETYNGQKLTPKGGGGTCFKAPINYINEQEMNPDLVIILTDGYSDSFPVAPDYPVLWALTVSFSDSKMPFGEVMKLAY